MQMAGGALMPAGALGYDPDKLNQLVDESTGGLGWKVSQDVLRKQFSHRSECISRAFRVPGSQPEQCEVFAFVEPAKGMPPHGRSGELRVIRRLVRDDH